MDYCEKYDVYNPGMIVVFNKIYSEIFKQGTKSNMVAACGEDWYRYLKYATQIVSPPKAKLVLVERDLSRYRRIKKGLARTRKNMNTFLEPDLHKTLKKTKVLHGDILTYESIPGIPIKGPSRIEDIGLGCRFDKLIYRALGRIDSQQKGYAWNAKSGRYFKKAQILDGSRRKMKDGECFELLHLYFSMLGAKLQYINRRSMGHIFRYGKDLGTYSDPITKHTCRVYEHALEFYKIGRIVSVKIYTYTNGGSMLSCLVVYR